MIKKRKSAERKRNNPKGKEREITEKIKKGK